MLISFLYHKWPLLPLLLGQNSHIRGILLLFFGKIESSSQFSVQTLNWQLLSILSMFLASAIILRSNGVRFSLYHMVILPQFPYMLTYHVRYRQSDFSKWSGVKLLVYSCIFFLVVSLFPNVLNEVMEY